LDFGVAGEVLIALIGTAGTLSSPMITQTLQGRRSAREAVAATVARRRGLALEAAGVFEEAKIRLDAALSSTEANPTLDSVKLYLPLHRQQTAVALEFGPQHPATKAYRTAVEGWTIALNMAAGEPQSAERNERIVQARNTAGMACDEFLGAVQTNVSALEAP
jgi:hypothetical protein